MPLDPALGDELKPSDFRVEPGHAIIHAPKAAKRTESQAIKKPIRSLHLGCGKRCATQAALNMHVSRLHRDLDSARAGKCPAPACTYEGRHLRRHLDAKHRDWAGLEGATQAIDLRRKEKANPAQ